MKPASWTILSFGLLFAATALAERVFLREADAPRVVFPEGTANVRRSTVLSESERMQLDVALGRRTDAQSYSYLEVTKESRVVGYVFLLDVIGQTQPISFAIGVTPSGTLRDLEVMAYREPRGDEIREERFRRQFVGKKIEDPLTLGRDVDAISGATISSRSATYAARKGLALAKILRNRGVEQHR